MECLVLIGAGSLGGEEPSEAHVLLNLLRLSSNSVVTNTVIIFQEEIL